MILITVETIRLLVSVSQTFELFNYFAAFNCHWNGQLLLIPTPSNSNLSQALVFSVLSVDTMSALVKVKSDNQK